MNILTILILLFTLTFFITKAQETITNESIVEMVELGFDNEMIIDKINSTDVEFDVSISELSKLKKAGVSTNVISLMMKKSRFNTKSKTGIYYLTKNNKQKLIQPSVFSGSSSNKVAQLLVSSFINAKVKSHLPKRQSNNIINTSTPEFIFIFDPSSSQSDNMQTTQGEQPGVFNWWFRTASSPNEFVLVKLKVRNKKNHREVITGKTNSVSNSFGIDSKRTLPFKIEEISASKFKVISENLEPGEYCFIYQGQVPVGRTNQTVFDFSIR